MIPGGTSASFSSPRRIIDEGRFVFKGQVDSLDLISKYFSYQDLERWYDTLDDLWMGLAAPANDYNDRFGDKVVVIKELLIRLAQAMYDLLDRPELLVPGDEGGPTIPPARTASAIPDELPPPMAPEKPGVELETICVHRDFALLCLPAM